MSAQDNMEKVLRELHVLLSKSNPYERDSNYLVVNKKEMLDILKQLAVCMSEVMDEYELTQQGRSRHSGKTGRSGKKSSMTPEQKQRMFMLRRLCIRMKRSVGSLILWMRRMNL